MEPYRLTAVIGEGRGGSANQVNATCITNMPSGRNAVDSQPLTVREETISKRLEALYPEPD